MNFKNLSLLLAIIFSLSFAVHPASADEALYQKARDYFEQEGIIKSTTRFTDNQKITKVEFLKIVLQNTGYNPDPKIRFIPTPFKDVNAHAWFAPYVQKAYRIGIVPKTEVFSPSASLRRIDAMKMILELEGYTVPKVYKTKVSEYRDLKTEQEKALAAKILDLGVYTPISSRLFGAQNSLIKRDALELIYKFRLIGDTDQALLNKTPVTITIGEPTLQNIEYLESVRDQLFSKYYKAEDLEEKKLMDSAIQGFVKGVGDPYSVYFPPQESASFNDTLQGAFEGIGAYLEETDSGIIIQTPIKGSPAEKAGVESGDIIKKVDGKDVTGMKVIDVVVLIKGPKGTSVTIEFERQGKSVTFTIMRDRVEIHSATAEVKNGILIISLTQFGAQTSREFSDIITKYKDTSLRGVIVDVRSNPGGFLTTAEDILSYWIPENESVVQLKYKTYTQDNKASKNQNLENLRTAILINKSSASASEILAGTLKDYGKAKLFGETSFGKGSVQEVIQYQNGASLKVTVAEWLTGKGNSINHVGVKPDTEVIDDKTTTNDEVMDRAMQWMQN